MAEGHSLGVGPEKQIIQWLGRMDREIVKTYELSLLKIDEIRQNQQATLKIIQDLKKINPDIEKSFESALKQIQADLDAYSK